MDQAKTLSVKQGGKLTGARERSPRVCTPVHLLQDTLQHTPCVSGLKHKQMPGNAQGGGRGRIEISLFMEWHQGTEKQIQMLRHKLSQRWFGHLVTVPWTGGAEAAPAHRDGDFPQTFWAGEVGTAEHS